VIYLDTSALVKLVVEEPQSAALAGYLRARPDTPRLSSELSVVELLRSCGRIHRAAASAASLLLSGIDLIPMDRAIVDRAATVPPDTLRSLDAIHLASLLSLREHVTEVIAYDHRFGRAAAAEGLHVVAPA
jgi:predicted nucleic acid-binding protein